MIAKEKRKEKKEKRQERRASHWGAEESPSFSIESARELRQNGDNHCLGDTMGKKVYTIEGKMYIIDDDTGDIQTIHIANEQVSPGELKEIIKFLAKLANKNEKDGD